MGYVKKGSNKSAIAGGSVGAILAFSAWMMVSGGSASSVLTGQRLACGVHPGASRRVQLRVAHRRRVSSQHQTGPDVLRE